MIYLTGRLRVAVVAGHLSAAVEVGERDRWQHRIVDAGLPGDGQVRRVARCDGRDGRVRAHRHVVKVQVPSVPVQLAPDAHHPLTGGQSENCAPKFENLNFFFGFNFYRI